MMECRFKMSSALPAKVVGGLLLLAAWCLWGGQAMAADEARISDCVVTNSTTQLLVYFNVVDAFTPAMEEAVQNGIPATFTFYLELYQQRAHWLDKNVVSRKFSRVLTYDSLKEEYLVTDQTDAERRQAFHELAAAERRMTMVNGLALLPLTLLTDGVQYRLRVKASLEKKTLPLNIHYLIPFSSLWDFETDWYEVVFRY